MRAGIPGGAPRRRRIALPQPTPHAARSLVAIVALSSLLGAVASPPSARSQPAPPASTTATAPDRTPLAVVDGRTFFVDEVEGALAFRIHQLELDIHALLVAEAERRIDAIVLAEAARAADLPVEALLARAEGEGGAVTEDEIDAYLTRHPADPATDPARARERVAHYLSERQRLDRRVAFLQRLRAEAGARVLLAAPTPPRTRFDPGDAPARGPADAPVVLVHFASMGSRHGARSAEKLTRLEQAHAGRIRRIHVQLLSPHDELGLHAARLAFVARSKGRFWPFHDAVYAALLADAAAVTPARLDGIAREVGLSSADIRDAAHDSRWLAEVKADIDRANAAGIPREPGLFVNGLFASGLAPYEELEAIVARELERVAAAAAAPR
ncbi:MAG: thioredoxin domain-containing protein [Myxococcota bacterium]